MHFANEGVDLSSRGGRLSADIQAVVATDFIRNLREETRKGFYGRLKQGVFPLPAPVGYSDAGAGKPKVPDPMTAPLVRLAFELYAGGHNLTQLHERMADLGLRTRGGSPLSRGRLAKMLNNPFYVGLMRLRSTKEIFRGAHQPIVPTALFDRVQSTLRGKTNAKGWCHDFRFRRLISCATCGRSLIGELQKGNVYYRRQTRGCPVTCIREDIIDSYIRHRLAQLSFTIEEKTYIAQFLPQIQENSHRQRQLQESAFSLRIAQLNNRFARLTDAFIDGMIDKEVFEQRKADLLLEQKKLEEERAQIQARDLTTEDQLAEYLELAKRAYFLYEMALDEEKRDLLKIVTSNRRATGKKLDFTMAPPFETISNREKNANGGPQRYRPRTIDAFLHNLQIIIRETPLELFDRISTFLSKRGDEDPTHSSQFH